MIENRDTPATVSINEGSRGFERIRFHRIKNGIESSEIARLLGINRSTYTNYETGRAEIPNGILKQIAIILDFDEHYFFDEYNYFLESVQENLGEALLRYNITQSGLARELGVSKQTAGSWSKGQTSPSRGIWEDRFSGL